MAQDGSSNTYYDLSYEKAEHIATITLDNSEKLNAMTGKMLESFSRAIEEVRRDDDVRVLVLTGRGRGFCTGADTELLIALAMEVIDHRAPEIQLCAEVMANESVCRLGVSGNLP